MSLEKAAQILEETARDVPFSTFPKILAAMKLPYPETLGGSCVYHARKVQERAGGDPLSAVDKVHYAVRFKEAGDDFLLDSSIGMREPINLSRVLKDGSVERAPAFPTVNGEASRVTAFRLGPERFKVFYTIRTQTGNRVIDWEYNLIYREEFPELGDRSLAIHPQPAFHLQRFEEEGGTRRLSFELQSGSFHVHTLTPEGHIEIRRSKVRDPDLQSFATRLGWEPSALFKIMSGCVSHQHYLRGNLPARISS